MPEHLQKTTPRLDVPKTIREISTSPDYIRARNVIEKQQVPEKQRIPTAVRMAATALRGKRPGEHLTLQEHSYNITAQLTTIEDTFIRLDQLNDRKARRTEKLPSIRKVAEFNHAVKDLIDENPRLQYGEVMGFMRTMNQRIHGRHGDRVFHEGIRDVLNGMRQELAAEQILGQIDNLEYHHPTVEEDVNGGDFFVSLDGSDFVPISCSILRLKKSKKSSKIEQEIGTNT